MPPLCCPPLPRALHACAAPPPLLRLRRSAVARMSSGCGLSTSHARAILPHLALSAPRSLLRRRSVPWWSAGRASLSRDGSGVRNFSSVLTSPDAKMSGLRVRADGAVEEFTATRRQVAAAFDMPARDLRQLVGKGAQIAVRPSYYIFSFPPFLAGCVSSAHAYLITSESGGPSEGHPAMTRELASRMLQRSITAMIPDSMQPFEHTVLEAVLREDMLRKQERFTRLSQLIKRMLELRDDPNISLRNRQLGLLRFGADRQAEDREQALYLLLTLSNDLAELEDAVRRAESSLSQVLGSDEDMAALYLSHRIVEGSNRAVDQHREVEYLLETAVMQLQWLEDRIRRLQGSVTTHRMLEELKLRNERNRIMRLDILLSMASVSLGLAAAITGMFGMNLASGLEEVPHGLWMCGAATWTLSGAMLVLLTSGIRRFHRSQRINVMQTASLRSVLKGFDHAYYALRHEDIAAEDADGTLRKDDARSAIEAAHVPTATANTLLDLMDVDDDGLLKVSEIYTSSREERATFKGSETNSQKEDGDPKRQAR